SGARRRLGFETCDLREPLSRRFLNEQVATAAYGHVIEKNLALASAAAGVSAPLRLAGARKYEFPIALQPDDQSFAEQAAARMEWRFAILNPGGGWSTKLWPAARFGELADYLNEEHGMRSYVTFGPGE